MWMDQREKAARSPCDHSGRPPDIWQPEGYRRCCEGMKGRDRDKGLREDATWFLLKGMHLCLFARKFTLKSFKSPVGEGDRRRGGE